MRLTLTKKQWVIGCTILSVLSICCISIISGLFLAEYLRVQHQKDLDNAGPYIYPQGKSNNTVSYGQDIKQPNALPPYPGMFREPIADFEGDKFLADVQITSDSECEEKIILGDSGAYICKNKLMKVSEQSYFEECLEEVKNSPNFQFYTQDAIDQTTNEMVYSYDVYDKSGNKILGTTSNELSANCKVSYLAFTDGSFYSDNNPPEHQYMVTVDNLLLFRSSECPFMPYECHPNGDDHLLDLSTGKSLTISDIPFDQSVMGRYYMIIKKISDNRIAVITTSYFNQGYLEGKFNGGVYIYSFPLGEFIDNKPFTFDKYDVPVEYGDVGTWDDENMYYFFNSYKMSKVRLDLENNILKLKVELSVMDSVCLDGKPKCAVNLIPGMKLRKEFVFDL